MSVRLGRWRRGAWGIAGVSRGVMLGTYLVTFRGVSFGTSDHQRAGFKPSLTTLSNEEKVVNTRPVRPVVDLADSRLASCPLFTGGQLTVNTRAPGDHEDRLSKARPPSARDSLEHVLTVDRASVSGGEGQLRPCPPLTLPLY